MAHAVLFGTVDVRNSACTRQPPLGGVHASYLTCTISFIFGWMAHSTSKSPVTGKVMLVLAARLLIAGIEAEFVGIDIGVMPQVAVVVDDLHRLAALDRDLARCELAALLRHDILRQRQRPPASRGRSDAATTSTTMTRRSHASQKRDLQPCRPPLTTRTNVCNLKS